MAARELQFNGEQDLTQDTMVLTQDTQVVATAHVGDQFQLQSLFDTAPAELFAAFDNGDEDGLLLCPVSSGTLRGLQQPSCFVPPSL